MDNRPFHLRHFSLYHHRSTMKVGTDSVILGAWVSTKQVTTVLDVGSGCGILALMMAQRTNAQIVAVELDEPSAREAEENFTASQWRNRLTVENQDFVSFANTSTNKYDLIISNPPFFNSVFKTKDHRRNLARHTDTLNFEELVANAIKLLNPIGIFAVVLPIPESKQITQIATDHGLHIVRRLDIIPVEGREPNRCNLEFGFSKPITSSTEQLIIRNKDGGFTRSYHEMLRPYYLGL